MSGRAGETRSQGLWPRCLIPVILCILGGCDSITGGGISFAEVTVFGSAPSGVGEGGGQGVADSEDPPATSLEGDIEVRLRVILGGGTGFPISLSGGDRTITVPIGGDTPVSLGRPSLVPGVYQGVRVIFTGVSATVTSGLGAGAPTGSQTVTVAFGATGSSPIGPERSLVLRDGDELQVTVDLRAPEWIGSAVSGGGNLVVPAAVFEEAVRVQARVR